MPARADVVMFAGPTLAVSARAWSLAKGIRVLPPVKRLDIPRLVARRKAPGALVIVDGVFHSALAVGHAEIRGALGSGWRVWGLSSMGAIRAREMAPLGMRGFGHVFDRFNGDDDFQDDEVALLHEATAPYRPITEPLVHLREAVDHLVEIGLTPKSVARAVIADLKSRWYGERTVAGTLHALTREARANEERAVAIRRELRDFDRFRIKTLDLERFLEEEPWRH